MKVSNVVYKINFSSRKTFKKLFSTCAYSGENFAQRDTKTIEHVVPQSRGGKNEYSNYLIVKRSINQDRSDIPLGEYIKLHPEAKDNIIQTVNSLEGQIIEGINWSKEIKKTLLNEIGYDIFEK